MSRQFLFAGSPLWGHMRPIISAAVHLLVQEPDLHVTFLTQVSMLENLRQEVVMHGHDLGDRLTFIACLAEWPMFSVQGLIDDKKLGKGCPLEVFTAVLSQKESQVYDKGQDKIIEISTAPVVQFIYDCFSSQLWSITRDAAASLQLDISSIPRVSSIPSNTTALIHHVAGSPNAPWSSTLWEEGVAELEAASPGSTLDKTDDELCLLPEFVHQLHMGMMKGGQNLIEGTDGQAPMFVYEFFPAAKSVPLPHDGPVLLARCIRSYVSEQTGSIIPWSESVLEAGALERARALLPDKDITVIGQQGPDSLWAETGSSVDDEGTRDPTLVFLDKVLATKGEKKALYISFGSVFFPALRPDLIVHLVETLLAIEQPFIFALASPFASLSAELVAKVEASGLGVFSKFAPQMAVLKHKATGWFLSHGGSNSTSEALISGVPLCFWPAFADQPGIAAWFAQEGLAYELLQVRTGPAIALPTARGVKIEGTPEAVVGEMKDVFGKMFGAEGAEVRKRVEHKSRELRVDRASGQAREGMKKLGAVGRA